VKALMQGEPAALMATDPPYGILLDHIWRDGVRQPRGSARAGTVLNDDCCDWREAYVLTDAPVAYVWHSALHAREAWDSLEAAGFEIRQQIVWEKEIHALSRAHYQWQHESCWYAVRSGSSARWRGGRDQTTVWRAPSPIMSFGSGADDAATEHPTQKPLLLFEKPIRNHTEPAEVVYEPFAGSGTQLIAAERLGRRCFALELDPAYCDGELGARKQLGVPARPEGAIAYVLRQRLRRSSHRRFLACGTPRRDPLPVTARSNSPIAFIPSGCQFPLKRIHQPELDGIVRQLYGELDRLLAVNPHDGYVVAARTLEPKPPLTEYQ
jgi:DNA methylase